jgi:hypothetical protein
MAGPLACGLLAAQHGGTTLLPPAQPGRTYFAAYFQKRSACFLASGSARKRFFFEKKNQKTFVH